MDLTVSGNESRHVDFFCQWTIINDKGFPRPEGTKSVAVNEPDQSAATPLHSTVKAIPTLTRNQTVGNDLC